MTTHSAKQAALRAGRKLEKLVVGFILALAMAAMFLLIGEPGVDWIIASPIFVLLTHIGPSSLIYRKLRRPRPTDEPNNFGSALAPKHSVRNQ